MTLLISGDVDRQPVRVDAEGGHFEHRLGLLTSHVNFMSVL